MEASTLSEDALGHEAEAQLFSLGNSLAVSGVLGLAAGPFHSCPPNSSSCNENWTHPRVYLAEPLAWQLVAACTPPLRLEETVRDKVLQLMEARRTWVDLPSNPCILVLLWE